MTAPSNRHRIRPIQRPRSGVPTALLFVAACAASLAIAILHGPLISSPSRCDPGRAANVTWAGLGFRARTWRVLHAAWSFVQMAGLGTIWASALLRRRSPTVWASVALLFAEGVALVAGRGNCPVGGLQAEWGDPVPFFELFLPPRAATAAVPMLAIISVSGIASLLVRRPGLAVRA
jgi:hypothetical protein